MVENFAHFHTYSSVKGIDIDHTKKISPRDFKDSNT